MKTKQPRAIRLSVNKEVNNALKVARRRYPALTDAEILKLGLSNITSVKIEADNDNTDDSELEEIRSMAAHSMGVDYLNDPDEDVVAEELLKKHKNK